MDIVIAKRMSDELIGKKVGGWDIIDRIGYGKSAVVFNATNGTEVSAVKVFDPELIERFGKQTQLSRIQRECELIGHDNNHLINILGGGECPDTKQFHVVMEKFDWPSLDEVIEEVPRDKIWMIIGKISDAAQYLEDRGIAHRDIKPSNIIISPEFDDVRLLDLGVIHPIGSSDLTDDDEKTFVGTLQYSSPELLQREEDDSVDGWRAVTFYQLGAVLHDLIMRAPIFNDHSNPWAKLVYAIKDVTPEITDPGGDPDLILLAKNCLVKNPALRLELTKWESFIKSEHDANSLSALKHRISVRQKSSQDTNNEEPDDTRDLQNQTSELLNNSNFIIRNLRTKSKLMPPAIQSFTEELENARGTVELTFTSTTSPLIDKDIVITAHISISSTQERAMSIECNANIENFIDQTNVYTGVYNAESIKSAIEEYILSVIDAAQQNSEQS